MKIKQLKQSIAALTVVSSGAAFGFGFDNWDQGVVPDLTLNAMNFVNVVCGPNCLLQAGEFSVSSATLRIDTTTGTDNLDGTISVTGVGVPAGGTDTGVSWDSNMVAKVATTVGTVVDLLAVATVVMWDWDITLDYNGKMLDWKIKSVTTVGAQEFVSCHTSGNGTTSSGVSVAYSGTASAVVCATIDPNAPPAGVSNDSTQDDYLVTCDITGECGQLNKSVPVPAFAAAALGLGLVGITYLTGRRKKIV